MGETPVFMHVCETVTINYQSFEGFNGDTIIIDATMPPVVVNIGMDIRLNSSCKIYVPAESIQAYKESYGWRGVANQIYAIQ